MSALYAEPLLVTDVNECNFYHTVELPSVGLVEGKWDLRPGLDAYLSATPFEGRRVLEVGTADGYLCFELEKRGAEVIAFDLAGGSAYDPLPLNDPGLSTVVDDMAARLQRMRNAYWLSHRLWRSRAKVVYGHIARPPDTIGQVDYCFMGNVLQHLESPLRALAQATRLARQGVIITEANWTTAGDQDSPLMYFLPCLRGDKPLEEWCFSWWQLTPGLVSSWLDLLGFDTVERYEHRQFFAKIRQQVPHFTIVANRRTTSGEG